MYPVVAFDVEVCAFDILRVVFRHYDERGVTIIFRVLADCAPNSQQLFQRVIKEAFPKVKFGNYSPKYVFHDRFYLVRDGNGQMKGVFGPSLNGLGSNAIALMGELEQRRALERLSEWLG